MFHYISKAALSSMDRIPRLTLFNAISGPKAAQLIATQNAAGQHNLAIFNSVTHISSDPALLGIMMRPLTVPRHTYNNIKETGFFSINQVHETMVQMAHQTSANYDEGISEFDACGFSVEYLPEVNAPFVKEARIKMGLSYVEEYHIKCSDTILLIGQVELLVLAEDILTEGKYVEHDKANSVCVAGLDTYYSVEKIARLDYARAK